MNEQEIKLQPLPNSSDKEFWEGETQLSRSVEVSVCSTHTSKNYLEHDQYIENSDGTISCKKCGWGFRKPGYFRVEDGRIVDLRGLIRK